MWHITNPAQCPAGPLQPIAKSDHPTSERVDTPSRLVTVTDCSTTQQIRLRVLVADPATGNVLIDRPVSALDSIPRGDVGSWSAQTAGNDGVIVRLEPAGYPFHAKPDAPSRQTYFNYRSGQAVDFGDTPESTNETSATFLGRDEASTYLMKSNTMRLYSANATARCQFQVEPWGVPIAMLGDQIVTLVSGTPLRLRAIDRATCRDVATVPVAENPGPIRDVYLHAAPGVTLLELQQDDGGMVLIGFSP
jgi:hypothetical protein